MEKHSNAFCPHCGSEKQYNYQFDAHYCELCNIWLENKCNDPNCRYCAPRLETPSKLHHD